MLLESDLFRLARAEQQTPFDVRPAVVFCEHQIVADGRRDRLAEGHLHGPLRDVRRPQVTLHAELAAEIVAGISGAQQHREGQHVWDVGTENIELQAGCEPPILVLQVAVGQQWQDAITVDDERVVVERKHRQSAGLQPADFRPREHRAKRALPGVDIDGIGVEAEGRVGGQEERSARGNRSGRVVLHVEVQDAKQTQVPVRLQRADVRALQAGRRLLGALAGPAVAARAAHAAAAAVMLGRVLTVVTGRGLRLNRLFLRLARRGSSRGLDHPLQAGILPDELLVASFELLQPLPDLAGLKRIEPEVILRCRQRAGESGKQDRQANQALPPARAAHARYSVRSAYPQSPFAKTATFWMGRRLVFRHRPRRR